MTKHIYCDVVIAGCGAAGLYTALNLPKDLHVLMICKEDMDTCDSMLAQGGICVLRGEDDYESYFEDTMRAGHYENRKESVDLMIRTSPGIIRHLLELGVGFDKNPDGSLKYTKEGAHSRPRICFHEDITGKAITTVLQEQTAALPNVNIMEYTVMTDILTANGLDYELYSDIKPNPTIENVKHGVEAFKASGADYLIAIGGGSSMDTSKAIGIIIANPEFEDVRSLEGTAPTKNPCVPIIAVPTTAGTAAEVTINYVITDVERKRKFVCVDPHDMPIIAVVDPDMMSSMPKGLTASTGMDALTHAIEGYTTKAAWEMTDMFHLKAIELISKSLRGAVANTKEGREGMALGQYIAGMGFSNVGLGIAHSMAHTLGAVYDTPHGVACAMMLPIVMEYNQECTGEKYREIARAMGVTGVDEMSQEEYRKAAIDAVKKLSADVGIPSVLEAVKEEDLQFLADSAHADACAPGNPKDASVEDLKDLFRKIMA
jgi:lactaldehyde reductase